MDQYYYEEGYIDASYFVYIAEADVQLTPYIVDYIESNYFEERGAWYSLYAEGIVPTAFEGEAALSVTATVTAVIGYFIDTGSTQSSAFTQSTTAAKTVSAACDFGALFAPSITAEGFRNHTAVLDSAFTIAIDAVANKAATLALANIVNISSQGIKTAVYNSNLTTTVTQFTTAQKTSTASSTQSSAFTQSVDFQIAILFSAAFSLTSSVYTSRYFGVGRPINLSVSSGSLAYSTAIKKFGTHSLTKGATGTTLTVNDDNFISIRPKTSDTFSMECWIYYPTSGTFAVNGGGVGVTCIGTSGNNFIANAYYDNNTAWFYSQSFAQINTNGWNHIAVSKSSNRLSVWVNGTRFLSVTNPTRNLRNDQINFNLQAGIYIDELSFSREIYFDPTATSITVPTVGRSNDATNTKALYHFDNNLNDDTAVLQSASSTLTASATVSTQAIKVSSTNANFNTSAQISIQGTLLANASSNVSSSLQISASAQANKLFESQQTSAFTQSSSEIRTREFDSTNNSLFTPAITAEGRLVGIALVNAVTTISIAAVKTTDVDSVQSISVTQTATAEKITDVISTNTSSITQTAAAERIRDFNSATSSAFIQASQEVYNVGFGVLLSTAVTISAAVLKLKRTGSDLSFAFTDSVIAEKTTDVISTQSLTTQQSTVNDRIRGLESLQTMVVSMTSDAVKTTDIAETLSGVTAQTAQAFKTTDVAVNHITLFGSSIDADITARPLVYLETQTSLSVLIGVIRTANFKSPIGVSSDSEDDPTRTPFLRFGSSNDQGSSTTNKFIMSFWAYKPIGHIFDSDPNKPVYTASGVPGTNESKFNSLHFENEGGISYLYYYGETGQVRWPIGNKDDYNHFLLSVDLSQSTNAQKYRLFKNGQEIALGYTASYGGVGAGFTVTPQSSPFNIPLRNYDQYLLMMDTNNNTYVKLLDALSSGYGDSDGQALEKSGLTQFWFDYDGSYDINNSAFREKFYNNGYVDLGENGTQSGLNQPKHYVRLQNYLDTYERGTKNSVDQQWDWYKLSIDETFFSYSTYVADAFTASVEENSLGNLPGIRGYFSLQGQAVSVLVTAGSLTSTTTMSVSANITADIVSDQSVSASASITANQFIGVIAVFAISTAETVNIGVITGNEISESVTVTLSAQPGFFQQAEAQLSDQFDFVCAFDAVPPTRGEADLVSAFTLSADAQSFTDAIIINTAFGTLVCDITVIPPIRVEADLTVTATMSVTIGSIEQFAVLTASLGTIAVAAVKTASAQSTQSVIANTSATPTKFTGIILTLYAFDSVLVAGDVINLDPYLTLWIKPESRTYEIPAETRIITILQETRVNIIEGYSQ